MPDPIHGYSTDEVAEIKQGILALGGISVNDLTADGLAIVADTGIPASSIAGDGFAPDAADRVAMLSPASLTITQRLSGAEADDLMQTLRCPGCGRLYAELPMERTWRAGEECRDA